MLFITGGSFYAKTFKTLFKFMGPGLCWFHQAGLTARKGGSRIKSLASPYPGWLTVDLEPGANEMETSRVAGNWRYPGLCFFFPNWGVRVIDRGAVKVGLQTWRQALAACFVRLGQKTQYRAAQGAPAQWQPQPWQKYYSAVKHKCRRSAINQLSCKQEVFDAWTKPWWYEQAAALTFKKILVWGWAWAWRHETEFLADQLLQGPMQQSLLYVHLYLVVLLHKQKFTLQLTEGNTGSYRC